MNNLDGPFGEWRAASPQTGAALTTAVTAAAAFVAFPAGSQYAYIEGRTFSTAVVAQYLFNPYLTIIKTTDSLATVTGATNYSEVAQNNKPVTGAVSLSSLATSGALWVGAEVPFGGVFFDVNTANSNTATSVVTYWSATGPTMATMTATDGTFSGVATFNVDGSFTWAAPADWTAATLRTAGGAMAAIPGSGQPMYWVRFAVSAALDSTTTFDQVLARNRSASYALLTPGRPGQFLALPTGSGRYGCIEAKVDAGTGFMIVNVATMPGGKFG